MDQITEPTSTLPANKEVDYIKKDGSSALVGLKLFDKETKQKS